MKILPGISTPFVGMEGTIDELQPHEEGIATMIRHIVVFERRGKRVFYRGELALVRKTKSLPATP